MTDTPFSRRRATGRALVALAALAAVAGCAPGGPPEMPPPEVNVAVVAARPIAEWDTYDGRIAAIESVELRPRVTGYLAGVHFREGGEVQKGALLFTVDDREYRAALASAQANSARAATRLEVARTEYARSEKLKAARAVSEEELETRRGELRQAEAELKSAQAQERQAELDVEFTRVRAPITGYASLAAVRPGNLVVEGQTLLTTIVSVDPVYVEFQGDERMYLKYQAMSRNGERPSSRDARNPVRVALADEQGFPHEGEMVFVDNALDPATGTIRARALLPNKDRVFTPGLFARVQLLGSGKRDTILVNERALLTDQDRRYVYVVGDDGKAMRRDVKLGGQAEGLRVVREGLKPGDRVVINGVRKIFFPGMPVKPVVVPMDQPDFAPPQSAGAPAGDAAAGDAPGGGAAAGGAASKPASTAGTPAAAEAPAGAR
jgi:multidrug efflux system membrane fusion protein